MPGNILLSLVNAHNTLFSFDRKLGSNIQPEVQAVILQLLLTGLEGRTWSGKESLLKALADIASASPEIMRENTSEDQKNKVVNALLKECRKEKVDYKIIALESTGTVFQQMKVDKFREMFEIVCDVLPKPEKEENGDEASESKDDNDNDEDDEKSSKKLDLLHSVLLCIGLCWPSSQDTAKEFLVTVMEHLELVAKNTTRKNQLALVKCLGNILKSWAPPQDIATSGESQKLCEEFFGKLAITISTLLAIPKYAQLRTETLQILSQAIKLLEQLKSSDLGNLFKNETTKSLDGVIKDLGSDPATKTTARDLKTALNNLTDEGQT